MPLSSGAGGEVRQRAAPDRIARVGLAELDRRLHGPQQVSEERLLRAFDAAVRAVVRVGERARKQRFFDRRQEIVGLPAPRRVAMPEDLRLCGNQPVCRVHPTILH